jgi:hypothetical protein
MPESGADENQARGTNDLTPGCGGSATLLAGALQGSGALQGTARQPLPRQPSYNKRLCAAALGIRRAHFNTKVCDHRRRPLMAPDRPNALPGLAVALDTLDQITATERPSKVPRVEVIFASTTIITDRCASSSGRSSAG